jgi:membrane dipeptidase
MLASDELAARASALLNDALACDLTLPAGKLAVENGTVERFAAAGFNFVALTLATDSSWIDETIQTIAATRAAIDKRSGTLALVRTVDDIERAKRDGKLAVSLNFQGTNPFQGNVAMVQIYYDLGVRQALMAYNQKNLVGDGCHERTDEGLSRFGLALVAEMNRVGMLVDCTHSGYRTTMDAMEASSAPCIFSHSLARALNDHERNINDEQIRALGKTGGVIGVNGIGFFMSADFQATTETICLHIDHIANLIGVKHIAIGLDYVHFDDLMMKVYRENKDTMFPKGYPPPPWQYWPPEKLGELVEALLRRGYSDDDVRGILGENFLRVARQVWR